MSFLCYIVSHLSLFSAPNCFLSYFSETCLVLFNYTAASYMNQWIMGFCANLKCYSKGWNYTSDPYAAVEQTRRCSVTDAVLHTTLHVVLALSSRERWSPYLLWKRHFHIYWSRGPRRQITEHDKQHMLHSLCGQQNLCSETSLYYKVYLNSSLSSSRYSTESLLVYVIFLY